MYKILVVEDEKIIRKGIIYGFDYEKMDCMVIGEARDGKEGVEQIKNLNPDIVITDINMPIMDAFEMFEETLEYSYSAIILSGYDEFENAKKAIKYGVCEFIVKPIEKEEMVESINRAIHQREVSNNLYHVKHKKEEYRQIQIVPEMISDSPNDLVLDMIEYVKDHYSERFILDDVGDKIGYSANYLCKIFKKHTSVSFNDYLNRYRIQQAIDLLLTSDKKVYEIAYDCGFKEYKYFNKVFKKYIGVSASEYVEIISEIH